MLLPTILYLINLSFSMRKRLNHLFNLVWMYVFTFTLFIRLECIKNEIERSVGFSSDTGISISYTFWPLDGYGPTYLRNSSVTHIINFSSAFIKAKTTKIFEEYNSNSVHFRYIYWRALTFRLIPCKNVDEHYSKLFLHWELYSVNFLFKISPYIPSYIKY